MIHGNVRGRTTEGGESQAQEEAGNFAQMGVEEWRRSVYGAILIANPWMNLLDR